MVIRDLKNYLSEKKEASLDELCFYLKQNKEVILHSLHLLIQKGVVIEERVKTPCLSCSCGNDCSDNSRIYKLA